MQQTAPYIPGPYTWAKIVTYTRIHSNFRVSNRHLECPSHVHCSSFVHSKQSIFTLLRLHLTRNKSCYCLLHCKQTHILDKQGGQLSRLHSESALGFSSPLAASFVARSVPVGSCHERSSGLGWGMLKTTANKQINKIVFFFFFNV